MNNLDFLLCDTLCWRLPVLAVFVYFKKCVRHFVWKLCILLARCSATNDTHNSGSGRKMLETHEKRSLFNIKRDSRQVIAANALVRKVFAIFLFDAIIWKLNGEKCNSTVYIVSAPFNCIAFGFPLFIFSLRLFSRVFFVHKHQKHSLFEFCPLLLIKPSLFLTQRKMYFPLHV